MRKKGEPRGARNYIGGTWYMKEGKRGAGSGSKGRVAFFSEKE